MYCTVGEVLEMIKDDMKNVIIGDEYIEDEQEREAKIATLCESAISDACAEIDGYLAKRYRVPFTKTPQVINKFAKDISVYNLVSRTGIDLRALLLTTSLMSRETCSRKQWKSIRQSLSALQISFSVCLDWQTLHQ